MSGRAAADSYDGVAGGAQAALSNAVQYIKMAKGFSPRRKIDVPVAVTFTKVDALLPAVPSAVHLGTPSPHCTSGRGCFIETDRMAVDAEIRTMLGNWNQGALITYAENSFSKASFFGVSALGLGNMPHGRSVKTPHPHRVEDPLLWIMSERGLIQYVR